MDDEQNLSVNDAPTFVGDLKSAPTNWPGGVKMSIQNSPWHAGTLGRVRLDGPVKKLVIGGVEHWVDEVCVFE
jgi:hypothetical protein